MKVRGWAGAMLMAVATAGPAWAQTATIDEGTFRILVSGREVGVETFSIRQNGTGADAVIIAQGRVALDAAGGGSEVVANVQMTGAGLRPVAYDVEMRGGDAQRIRGTVTGRRASARTVAGGGQEQWKEYLVTDGAVLLDDGMAHHYYFIAQRFAAGSSQTPIMIPRESRQVQVTITAAGTESVAVGSGSASARKLVVQPAGGDARTVWIDAEGRVLRVEVPARNYVAVRTAMP